MIITSDNRLMINTNENVGLNISFPSYKLDVTGIGIFHTDREKKMKQIMRTIKINKIKNKIDKNG